MLGVGLELEAGVFHSILCALRWHLSALWAEAATSTSGSTGGQPGAGRTLGAVRASEEREGAGTWGAGRARLPRPGRGPRDTRASGTCRTGGASEPFPGQGPVSKERGCPPARGGPLHAHGGRTETQVGRGNLLCTPRPPLPACTHTQAHVQRKPNWGVTLRFSWGSAEPLTL